MRAISAGAACFAAILTTPAFADPPLAGVPRVFTSSHGQAFCTDRSTLAALLRATISEAPFPFGAFPGCVRIADGVPVTVIEDLSPGTRMMHVVRARAVAPFGGGIEGYTYSVGLYQYGLYSYY